MPPRLLGPASMEVLDLDIDGDLSSLLTAKAANLAKLAPQLTNQRLASSALSAW